VEIPGATSWDPETLSEFILELRVADCAGMSNIGDYDISFAGKTRLMKPKELSHFSLDPVPPYRLSSGLADADTQSRLSLVPQERKTEV
jgi:hypothetical protein